MRYINPKDFFDAMELRAVVCTSSEGERFVEFYNRFNEENNIVSFPAVFSGNDIHDGDANPYLFMLEEYEPKRYRVINRDSIGTPIYQMSVEEYTGFDEACCIVKNGYVSLELEDAVLQRLKLENPDDAPEGMVENSNITIRIDDGDTWAYYDK